MAVYDDILGTKPRPAQRQSPIPSLSPDIPGANPSTQSGQQTTENGQPSTRDQRPSNLDRGANKVNTPTTQNSQPTTQNSTSAIETIVSENPRRLNYAQLYEVLNAANRPETPEQQAAREKKEKRQALFSAIGDGISALSNLYFTTRYAPDSFTPSRAMSPTTRARWDRLRAEREANRRQYVDGYLRALQLDDADYRYERSWQHQMQREKLADDRAAAAEKRAQRQAELDEQLAEGKIAKAQYEALVAESNAKYADDINRLKKDKIKSEISRNKAAAGASNAAANASNKKAELYANGGKTLQYRAWDKNGKEKWFPDKDAAEMFAQQEGTYYVQKTEVKENISKTEKEAGIPKTTNSTKTTIKEGNGFPVPYRPPYRNPDAVVDDEFSQYEVKGDDQDDDFSQYER